MSTTIFRRVLAASVIFSCLFPCIISTHAAEEVCGACEKRVLISGRFEHAASDVFAIEHAVGEEAAFRDDIHGPDFTLTVSNLDAGKYSFDIGEVELRYSEPGWRLFNILCDNEIIVSNFDIIAAAHGPAKAVRIRGSVDYPGQTAGAPFTLRFVGLLNEAKLNTFQMKDPSGAVIIDMKAADLITGVDASSFAVPTNNGPELWKDPSQPTAARAKDLVSRMSLAEKAAQMRNAAPGIPRIGLPAYNYWNECLHGVARSGVATVFPQAIGMAAMWNPPLLHDVADTIATEARAKHNEYARTHDGDSARYYGLTFWTPNINIFRDPRWGRGQETYGEDPFLTSRLAVAFIRGLQGDDPKYIKAMACAKHFAVHSGPESTRHVFDAEISERDLYETYLPHFEAAVREGKVGTVMGAYNSLFGTPACANTLLLDDILRKRWGFDGQVVSDCGAIFDIYANHNKVATPEEAAALAVKAGCDLCCGNDYGALPAAVRQGLITEAQIDTALERDLTARFRLGLFDPPDSVPYARIPFSENDTPAHEQLALGAARESMVLLKNDGILPLDRTKIKRIAIFGGNANSVGMLVGNYNGNPSRPLTILDGISNAVAAANIEIVGDAGAPLAVQKGQDPAPVMEMSDRGAKIAATADVIIYVGGLHPLLEGEQMDVEYLGFSGGDRTAIELPEVQTDFLKVLKATGKPVIFVDCSGSAVAIPWAAENLPAILQAWYPGEQGGRAVADVLFGDYNPAGRLPVTFYKSTDDLPAFDNYSMSNRTYRYFTGKPLYAFGHGLSYTKFDYQDATLDRTNATRADSLTVTVNVKNTGPRDGEEVVQVYYHHLKSALPQAREALCGFSRVNIPAGKTVPVTIKIPVEQFRYWDTNTKDYAVEPGPYELLIGPASDNTPQKLAFEIR